MIDELSPAPVLLHIEASVATLTLNDPARLNPLTAPLLQAALTALDMVRRDPQVRVLVLQGAGRAFSCGADLTAVQAAAQAGASADDSASGGGSDGADDRAAQRRGQAVDALLGQGGNPLVLALQDFPVPVLCAVQGAAAGGGVGLALAADVVIAGRSAYFYLPFVPALGLVPDMGSAWFMLRTLGAARTRALTLLGERLSAEQAAQAGLIWACVADDQLAVQTQALALRLAALPAHGVQETRALLRQAAHNTLPGQLDYERQRQAELMAGAAANEGVAAFVQRRKPQFAGRE